jgi:hypothetical protein
MLWTSFKTNASQVQDEIITIRLIFLGKGGRGEFQDILLNKCMKMTTPDDRNTTDDIATY